MSEEKNAATEAVKQIPEMYVLLNQLVKSEAIIRVFKERNEETKERLKELFFAHPAIPEGMNIQLPCGEVQHCWKELPFYNNANNLAKYVRHDSDVQTGLKEHVQEWNELQNRIAQLRKIMSKEIAIIKSAHPYMDIEEQEVISVKNITEDIRGLGHLLYNENILVES